MRSHQAALAMLLLSLTALPALAQEGVTRYVRYEHRGSTSQGILADGIIHQIEGDLLGSHRRTGTSVPLSESRLLAPIVPGKVIAVGLNYRSHLGERDPAAYPGLFAKYPSSVVGPEAEIVRPADSRNLHYEGELVIVIGRRAKNVRAEDADDHIFGITAGNDVSERDWQRDDLQWFRAKASDTFAPMGPAIVRGVDYRDLRLETRLNGEVRQSARTSELLFNVPEIVSYVSRYVTLEPGDVIYTGTPGTTQPMQPGDVVEVELEGVGVLRNRVVSAPGMGTSSR